MTDAVEKAKKRLDETIVALLTIKEPYTFHCEKRGWFGVYSISYDDTKIRTVSGMDKEDVENIVLLLNAAFREGYLFGRQS